MQNLAVDESSPKQNGTRQAGTAYSNGLRTMTRNTELMTRNKVAKLVDMTHVRAAQFVILGKPKVNRLSTKGLPCIVKKLHLGI